jgi:hypothetical protein
VFAGNYYFGFYSAVFGFCAPVVYLEAASLHSSSLGLPLPSGAYLRDLLFVYVEIIRKKNV